MTDGINLKQLLNVLSPWTTIQIFTNQQELHFGNSSDFLKRDISKYLEMHVYRVDFTKSIGAIEIYLN